MMKKKTMVAAVALSLAASAANAVLVDFDGPGGATGPIDVGGMGWSTTSAVAQGGTTAIGNFLAGTGSTTFNVLTHARLVDTTNSFGIPNTPSGLNSSYEITMVARFQETVTGANATTGLATFATTGTGLVQIYFGSAVNSNDLTGFGFNDGRLILQGTLAEAGRTGLFLVTSATPTRLDQFPGGVPNAATDDYCVGTAGGTPGTAGCQGSVEGTGTQGSIGVDSLTRDPAFFIQALSTFGVNFANISQQLPFRQAQPSDCFSAGSATSGTFPGPGAVGTNSAGSCLNVHNDTDYAGNPDGTGYVPVVGLVNGLFPPTGGPDFVFQTRYDATLNAAVPEPGSLALLGLGLGALGFGAVKRRRTAA